MLKYGVLLSKVSKVENYILNTHHSKLFHIWKVPFRHFFLSIKRYSDLVIVIVWMRLFFFNCRISMCLSFFWLKTLHPKWTSLWSHRTWTVSRLGWLENGKGSGLSARPLTLNSASFTTFCISEKMLSA